MSNRRIQSGSTLVASLVLMLLLTGIGILAVRGSMLEYRIANNSAESTVVFQLADSMTEHALNDSDNLARAYEAPSGIESPSPPAIPDIGQALTSTVSVTYTGSSPVYGFSADQFKVLRYVVDGTVESIASQTRSQIKRGALRIVPTVD